MNKRLLYYLLVVVVLSISSCNNDDIDPITIPETEDYSSEVIFTWTEHMLLMTKDTPGFSPPVAARVYGYTGLALYEGLRQGMPHSKTMEGQITDFASGTVPTIDPNQEYHWGAVANSILYVMMKNCFKIVSDNHSATMDNIEQQFDSQFRTEVTDEVIDRSIAFGELVANAMLDFANSDGQEECYLNNFPQSYTVPTGEGLWRPTNPTVTIPLQPYWGEVRPFMTSNIVPNLPIAPPAYSTDPLSDFYKEALEVYEIVQNLQPEEQIIAQFWSDDPGKTATPPGHSISIMVQILKGENANLATTAELYAKLGMALHDSFISCWYAKYVYNLVRPVSFIHEYIDNSWTTLLATPPFPEYTSGHSVQSAAAAQVLTDFYGDNYSFTDKTHNNRNDIDGSTRTFTSFYEFANEAAISRLFGGIHYRSAIEYGVDQGLKIGENIGTLKFR